MPQNAKKLSEDALVQYTTPMAAAVHQLCVERLQRTLQRSAAQCESASADLEELNALLAETTRDLDKDTASLKALLATHGIDSMPSFAPPQPQVVRAPSETVRSMLEMLQRFDTLVVCALTAHVQALLPGESMDRLLDGYMMEMLGYARSGA